MPLAIRLLLIKDYNPDEVRRFTTQRNFPPNVDWVHAKKVYLVLFVSALVSLAGSLVHHFPIDLSLLNFFIMIWWISYFRSNNWILISVVGASFFFGLTVGAPHVATYLYLNERTPSYALASAVLLFGSQMATLFTHSPAIVFNSNIVALPLFIYVLVFTQLFFSFPFIPKDSPPPGVFMTYIHLHLLPCSLIFFTFIACAWITILKFFRDWVSNLRFGILVPVHLHLLSLLIYLSGYSVYYLMGVYTVWLLIVYNVHYHVFDTLAPPAVSVSHDVPPEALIPAPNGSDQAVIIPYGGFPQAHSSVLSFFTLFVARSTYILSQPVSVIVVWLWGICHVEFEAIWVSVLRNWQSAKTYGLRVWRACYAFYGKIIEGGRLTVHWLHDFMFKAATISFFVVMFLAIVFAFKN